MRSDQTRSQSADCSSTSSGIDSIDASIAVRAAPRSSRATTSEVVTVAEQLAVERPLLRVVAEAFDATETAAVRVDSKALVTVRQNRYSVPVALAGLRVSAQVGATEIRISHNGAVVARHERLHGKFATAARLDHYLELLARKPGGLERSLPLAQERQRGSWPECFDELWAALTGRYGASQAACHTGCATTTSGAPTAPSTTGPPSSAFGTSPGSTASA